MYLKVSGDIGFTLKSLKGEKVGGSDALVEVPPSSGTLSLVYLL